MNNVYLKHSQLSTVRNKVLEKVGETIEKMKGLSGNDFIKKAEYFIEESRSSVADFFSSKSREIRFTYGGTDSNSIAVLGAPQAMEGKGNNIFIGSTEPGSIIKPAKHLKKIGYKILEIPVNEFGIYDLEFISDRMNIETTFISVSRINKETGIKQDITNVAKIAKQVSAVVHTDASFGLIEPLNVSKLGVDLMSVGGEFIGSFSGSGILFVREGTLIETLKAGKRHFVEKKPDMDNVLNAVAISEALQDISETKNEFRKKLSRLRQIFDKEVAKEGLDIDIISTEDSYQGIMCISPKTFYDAESIVEKLSMKGVYVYTGVETISDDEKSASHVLINMGMSEQKILSSFTASIGWDTTDEDMKTFVKILSEIIKEK